MGVCCLSRLSYTVGVDTRSEAYRLGQEALDAFTMTIHSWSSLITEFSNLSIFNSEIEKIHEVHTIRLDILVQTVLFLGQLIVRSTHIFTNLFFVWGHLPLMSSTLEFVFHWGHLPFRSFSIEVLFYWGPLPLSYSSIV